MDTARNISSQISIRWPNNMYCSNLVDKVLYNRFDEGIQLETLALRFLYGGQITCTVVT